MSKRVLVIDDEAHLRQMMRLALEMGGYEVGEAKDGLQGIDVFGDGSTWDAVLLDQKMPGLDGLETLRGIKQRDQAARVIMVTAFASIELAVDAMKLGATDFVRKPMTPEILRNAVTAALRPPRDTARLGPVTGVAGQFTEPTEPLIKAVTMNGFQIVRASDAKSTSHQDPGEHRFIVQDPQGQEQEVVVQIDEEALGYVERLTRRRLPLESSFWTLQAERFLSAFLWNNGIAPHSGKLLLKGIDRHDIDMAARWKN
ncbi:MAG: response regulator [Acidobacteriota bacterium]|nr:response regulator [Acidobacteriota bacterium]